MERAAVTGWATASAAGPLDPQGPGARAAADLWWLMFWLGIAVFVLFAVLLAAGLLPRRGDEPTDGPDPRRLVGRWIVAGGVVLPLVVIAVVFGANLRAMRLTPSVASSDALLVEVTAHQFWYEIRYPDQGVVTANEMHVPVGRDIELRLASADVIHSFWVPALGGKMDMLPERTNTLVLRADEPGEHHSRCAEFCGLQHARMGFVAVAEPAEQFDAWIAEHQQALDAEPDSDAERRGRQVFVQSGCADCHALPGARGAGTDAPDLTNLAGRRTLGAAVLDNTPDDLAAWIRDPHEFKPGVGMPATELSDEELEALLAYLGAAR